jgi:hypothetical protein
VPGSGVVLTLVQSWFWENQNRGKDQNRHQTGPCYMLSEVRSKFLPFMSAPRSDLGFFGRFRPHAVSDILFGRIYPHGGLDIKFIEKCPHNNEK